MMNKPILFLTLTLTLALTFSSYASDTKQADLAGNWYPANREELIYLLGGYLESADPDDVEGEIFAIIAPHAGYRFSGPVAAHAFKAVRRKAVKTVIVIGFAHRKFFDGISIYDRGSFTTPLGELSVDTELAKKISAGNPKISYYPDAFSGENSIEMQLPFIQMVFGDARIVPIAFGNQSYEYAVILADALSAALKERDDCLIVASTDMSHYHPYEEAKAIDSHAIRLLESKKVKELYDEVSLRICEFCGVLPVAATLLAAEKLGFGDIRILKYANSGDTFGPKEDVVGYVSAVIYKKSPVTGHQSPAGTNYKPRGSEDGKGEGKMLNETQRKRLLQIARESVTGFVRDGKRRRFTESDPVLNMPMGAFVTLHEGGELRGCIGNMIGQGPLYQTVADMAIEAGTGDPRFPAVSSAELDKIEIEISVLSPMKRVSGPDEIKVPGHGVIVRQGGMSGVYLPQVAEETGWSKEEFLTSLCAHKAGLAPDAWRDPATEMYVFTAEVFGEKGGKR
ncbi:MAG: AmmeMemoRadiSam system protein B [Candidatus Omnitrophota bacterium]